MYFILGFLLGAVIGFIAGFLVFRNNAKKLQTKEQAVRDVIGR